MAEREAPVHTPSPRNINLTTTHRLEHLYGSPGIHPRCSSTSVEQKKKKKTERDAFLRGIWKRARRTVSLYCITHPPRQASSEPRDSLVHSFSFGKANWVSAPPTFARCCPKGHSVCSAKNTEAICTTEYSLSQLEAERKWPRAYSTEESQQLATDPATWPVSTMSPAHRQYEGSSKKLKIGPHDPAVPLLNIYSKELKSGSGRNVCTLRFTEALFTTAKGWSQKTLMLGKIEGRKRRGWQRMRWLDGITWWTWV